MKYINITPKGQITIPVHLRRKYNLQPGTQAEVIEERGEVKIKPVKSWDDMFGIFKSNKSYSKKQARKIYMPDVLAGKI
jgi:AbrB family looped-hinge helix DNA binding protein